MVVANNLAEVLRSLPTERVQTLNPDDWRDTNTVESIVLKQLANLLARDATGTIHEQTAMSIYKDFITHHEKGLRAPSAQGVIIHSAAVHGTEESYALLITPEMTWYGSKPSIKKEQPKKARLALGLVGPRYDIVSKAHDLVEPLRKGEQDEHQYDPGTHNLAGAVHYLTDARNVEDFLHRCKDFREDDQLLHTLQYA